MTSFINVVKNQQPILFIVMGVSGSGKSSLAINLAEKNSLEYLDADDFHSEAAKQYMAANNPLTDEMRLPWLKAIIDHLKKLHNEGKSVALAYSGLKLVHRELFRELAYPCYFFYLVADREVIAKRITQRKEHFFSADLLDSQFEAMEEPSINETNVMPINVSRAFMSVAGELNSLVKTIQKKVNHD